jgi:hypothetical protein
MKKRCARCRQRKPVSEFYERGRKKGTYMAYCKLCCATRHRAYYESHPDKYRKKKLTAQRRAIHLLHRIKAKPCVDCGKMYPPYVMDLDHRNPRTKIANPSILARNGQIEKLREEAKKCDVVCANCHRERTFG